MALRLWEQLNWTSRRFGAFRRRFGYAAAFGAYRARVHCRLFSAGRSRAADLALGALGTIRLRPGISDWAVLEQVLIDQGYDCGSAPHEKALRGFYDAVCAVGKTPLIVDGGANIGLASLWFAERFPKARIVAIEPEPTNFALVEANLARYANVTVLRAALWDRETTLELADGGNGPWSWQTRVGAGDVPTVTVPDLLARFPDTVPMIAKIDIEGAEAELFRSHSDWADRFPLIAFEPHDWMVPWRGTFHAVASALIRDCRDYIIRGEAVFAFSHRLRPGTVADAPAAELKESVGR